MTALGVSLTQENPPAPWVDSWYSQVLQIDPPLDKTLNAPTAMQASWTLNYRARVGIPVLTDPTNGVTPEMQDPTAFLEAGKAVSLGLPEDAERMYNALMAFWKRSVEHETEFHDVVNGLFTDWQGVAADNCRAFVGAISDFITAQRQAVLDLATCILAVRSAIDAAQQNLAQLMTTLEQAVHEKIKAEKAAAHQALLHDIEAVVGAALTIAATLSGQIEAVPALLTLTGAVASVGATAYDGQQAEIDASKGWPDMLDQYFKATDRIRNALGDQLSGPILDHLRKVDPPAPPVLPAMDKGSTPAVR